MLRNFSVIIPNSLDEALNIIDNISEPFKIINGGTDVLVYMKENPGKVKILVDISKLKELNKIEERKNTIIIGSGVKHEQILNYPTIKTYYNALYSAVSEIGSPQIRALGTIGGNIANASPAGDSICPLIAFDSEIEVRSKNEVKILKLENFFIGPKKTILNQNEIITKIIIPKSDKPLISHWKRLGQRNAMAISKVSVAIACDISNKNSNIYLNDIKIALGAVAPTVIRAKQTEDYLKQSAILNQNTITKACELIEKEVMPITDLRSTSDYRTKMCSVLLNDLLLKLN